MSAKGVIKKSVLSRNEQKNKYHVSGYNIDLDNDNDSHTIIVKSVVNANSVLDVGCGPGYIGECLKKLGVQKVDGIEIDREARKIAAQSYNKVYRFSVDPSVKNRAYLKFLKKKKKYDYIIFADILEHLSDPGRAIADFSRKLSGNGKMIISIPNISNIDVIIGLLNQNFNYSSTGILDSTHLRFFTENSFYDLLDNINDSYGLNLQARLISHTYARDESVDTDLLVKLFGSDIFIFQNVFEISQVVKPRQPRKKVDNYKKFLKYIKDLERKK